MIRSVPLTDLTGEPGAVFYGIVHGSNRYMSVAVFLPPPPPPTPKPEDDGRFPQIGPLNELEDLYDAWIHYDDEE